MSEVLRYELILQADVQVSWCTPVNWYSLKLHRLVFESINTMVAECCNEHKYWKFTGLFDGQGNLVIQT